MKFILDPGFAGMEPSSPAFSNKMLGRRFGIAIHNKPSKVVAQSIINVELLACYSLQPDNISGALNHLCYDIVIDNLPLEHTLL